MSIYQENKRGCQLFSNLFDGNKGMHIDILIQLKKRTIHKKHRIIHLNSMVLLRYTSNILSNKIICFS
ncbi:hypothetical protein CGS26_04475 [Clostridium sporogenes]|uniref:Uncharacterized protein n=1 Tax=Clostridium sporogenes TaxID=1509 RepID=A0AAE6LWL8_CLOSG|nr:hypothetical protein CGS26_04475 [Clostridium sporogenes]